MGKNDIETMGMDDRGPIEPLFNDAFVRIFGREDSKVITRSLVNAVLERAGIEQIGEIEQISAEHGSPEGSVECKTPRFDVHIVAESRMIDLEAQRYPANIGNRGVFYAANALVAGTKAATSYSDLPQAIVVTLLDDPSPFPDDGDFVHVCRWYWSVSGEFVEATDRQLLVLVELSKVRERYNRLDGEVLEDKLLSWAYLITNGFKKEGDMEEIVATYPDIEEFAELYGLAVTDPKVKQAYWDAKTAVLEYNNRQEYFAQREREGREKGFKEGYDDGFAKGEASGVEQGLEKGLEKGLEQGIEQGIEQGTRQMAERLRALGVDESVIAQALESD